MDFSKGENILSKSTKKRAYLFIYFRIVATVKEMLFIALLKFEAASDYKLLFRKKKNLLNYKKQICK